MLHVPRCTGRAERYVWFLKKVKAMRLTDNKRGDQLNDNAKLTFFPFPFPDKEEMRLK